MTTTPRGPTTTTTTPPTADHRAAQLDTLAVRELVAHLASSNPTPGGGSASALAGTLAAALVAMVARLTEGRTATGEDAELVRATLAEAGRAQAEMLELASLDANAYAAVVRARRLPRGSDAERTARATELVRANRLATDIPLRTARAGAAVLALAASMVAVGNPHAISDLGVAAHLAAACVHGAILNVRINLSSLAEDDPLAADLEPELDGLVGRASEMEARVAAAVIGRMAEPRAGAKPTPR